MKQPDARTEPECAEAPKKPYRKPRLITYGDIREITQAVGTTGNPDGVTKTGLL
jgi:hypothetical protein